MTANLLDRLSKDATMKAQDLILVTWLDNSLCVIRQKGGQWQELRCRSGLQPGDESTASQMLRPFIDGADPGTRVVLMEDTQNGEFSRNYLPLFGNLSVSDVTEETTRLRSHFEKFKSYFVDNGPVGRSMDFLCQEMNREFNTIGSKANDAALAQSVVLAKTELEKLREQVQNVE